MANTVIRLKKSSISGRSPTTLEHGELAINYTDGKLFYKDDANVIQRISGGANSFMYMNVNSTMLVAGVLADVLTVNAGDNIEINTDALTNKYTITANLFPAFRVANAAYALANDMYNVSTVVSNTAPANPVQGKLWWNSILGTLFVYYVDPDGTTSWVEAVPNGGGTSGTGEVGTTDISPAFNVANAAFAKANAANVLAYNTGVGANNYAGVMANAANSYAGSMANAANAYAASLTPDLSPVFAVSNAAFDKANAANVLAYNTGIGANNYANDTFLKLTSVSQTITGNVTITGNLNLLGGSTIISSNNLSVGDSLIYLAANNYSGTDILDIGFIANYGNTTGANVHTGLVRDATDKQYYLFQSYDAEPANNTFVPGSNNMVNAVLVADLNTSNLTLGGANAITWINSAFDKANTALQNTSGTLAGDLNVTGNVAIGISSPNTTLQVNGSMSITGANFANAYLQTLGTNTYSNYLTAAYINPDYYTLSGTVANTVHGFYVSPRLIANNSSVAVNQLSGVVSKPIVYATTTAGRFSVYGIYNDVVRSQPEESVTIGLGRLLYGTYNYVGHGRNVNSAISTGQVFGTYNNIQVPQANVGFINGTHNNFQIGSTVQNNSVTISTINGLYTTASLVTNTLTTLTTTVNYYYDAYLAGISNGNANTYVTNKYGVYQNATDHKNYFAGNTGIGTSTPTQKLDVVGSANVSGSVRVVGSIYSSSSVVSSGLSVGGYINISSGWPLYWGSSSPAFIKGFDSTDADGSRIVIDPNNNGGDQYVFRSSGFRVANSDFIVSGTGSVGIGTTSPTQKLDVVGSANISGNVIVSGIAAVYAPNRPAFRVYGSGTTNNLTITQNGTGALTANNWTVDYNQGTYLANTNGVFTAPVAGLYQVDMVIRNSGYTSGIMQGAVVKNATGGAGAGGSVVCMVEFASSSTMNHAGASSIIKLAVGDTLALKVLAGQITFDSNDNWSVAYIG